ncbi:MAG: DUF2797 domain-containing protein [Candidatus Shikimatogenerans bostrichidophilus]|nr:MAG: DUF2797 domain-containing protein [Candidatus Shikimatogenerans bostrichidophilus]
MYYLIYNYKNKINLNKFLNKTIKIILYYTICLSCKNLLPILKDGYCKFCYYKNFYIGIYHPTKCIAHLNKENKNLIKEKEIELKDHIVYISYTSNFKIGITSKDNILNRLMDQGAVIAILLAKTPNRYLAGYIEYICKKLLSDRTNYRKIFIRTNIKKKSILSIKNKVSTYIINNFIKYSKYLYACNIIYKFKYPILKYINKALLLRYKNKKIIYNKLIGIKGQYLIFYDNTIVNFRNLIGHVMDLYIY